MELSSPPSTNISNDNEVEILVHQLHVGTELYLHEDRLNWQKLNNLLYVNAAIGAMISFVLERELAGMDGFHLPYLVLVVGLIGSIVSFGFAVAIWYGTLYLQTRKDALLRLEEHMQVMGAFRLLQTTSVEHSRYSRFHRQSPTIWILRLIPIGLGVIWFMLSMGYMLLT